MKPQMIAFDLITLALLLFLGGPAGADCDTEMSVVVNNDDGAPGYVEELGEWNNSGGIANCPGISNSTSRYTIQVSNPGATATFTPDIPYEGYYRIEMALPVTSSSSDHALYVIRPGGGEPYDSVWINQNTDYACDWRELGIYPLVQGMGNSASVINDGTFTSGYVLRVDLMKFTYLYPVPVVLSSFQASAGQGFISLDWVTASEINCHRWEIYRSDQEDGDYAKISELPGHGSSETPHAYRWVDKQVHPEVTYYYKLKQVDFHGSSSWSFIVSATAWAAVPKIYALHQNYPNPFNSNTQIDYQIPEDHHVGLKIFNPMGQDVRTLVDAHRSGGEHTEIWDARDDEGKEVASGLYFCRLQAGVFGKIIKMVLVR